MIRAHAFRLAELILYASASTFAAAQASTDATRSLQHDRIYTYLLNDGSCISGELEKADASSLTIRQYNKPSLKIPNSDLMQMGQGDELFFSSRSSWTDVEGAKIYPREALVLKLNDGQSVKGLPKSITSNSIILQQGFITKDIKKDQIRAVLSLKLKPPTSSFEFLLSEAGFFTVFTPEFYERAFGLEGRISVRLYDSSLPEDDADGIARCNPKHIPGYRP